MVLWRVEMEVADPKGPERSGRIAHAPPDARPDDAPHRQQEIARVPTQTTAGRSLVICRAASHIDGLRFGPGCAPRAVVQVDLAMVRPRDLADSATDVA